MRIMFRGIGFGLLPIVVILASTRCSGSGGPVEATPDVELVTITGRVTAVDGGPLAGVEVILNPVSRTTLTDADGRYGFVIAGSGEPFFDYVLEVHGDGYESVVLGGVVRRGGGAVVDVALAPTPGSTEPAPIDMDHGIVLDSSVEDEVGCIAPDTLIAYSVRIGNEAEAPVRGIVLHDTLDTGFGRSLAVSDVVVDRSRFPNAIVRLDPGGRSFQVELADVPPMAPATVYTVSLPVGAPGGGVYCNRVTALGPGEKPLADARSCVANTLAIRVDLENEDGAIVEGVFSPAPEVFHVGDGGPERADGLVFRVAVTNGHCMSVGFPLGDMSLTSMIGARSGGLVFREVVSGFPTRGAVRSTGPGGFEWSIGTLGPGEVAEIRFRAEAILAGDDIHRVVLTVPQFTGDIVNEESVTVLP